MQDGPDLRFRVVGIEASTGEFPPLPGNVLPPVHMTRAFTERYASDLARSDILYVRLQPDATPSEFLAAAQALRPDTTITVYSDGVDNAATVSRSIHFQAIGLGILALLVGLSVTFALAQAFGRQAYDAVDDDAPVLRALGLRDRQFLALAAIRAGVTAVVGAMLATGVAVALSPLWPVGLAAKAEPTPGATTDGVVLVVGIAAILVVAMVGAIVGTMPLVRRSTRRRRVGLARALPTSLPVPAAVGVRHALDPGRGRTRRPRAQRRPGHRTHRGCAGRRGHVRREHRPSARLPTPLRLVARRAGRQHGPARHRAARGRRAPGSSGRRGGGRRDRRRAHDRG